MTAPVTPTSACPISGNRPVPRLVLRAGQRIVRGPLRITADGIAYPNPDPADRDAEGILWPRIVGEETGDPLYADVNPLRQRAAMENPQRLLCQVGMGPATVGPDGVLWIVPRPTGSAADPHQPGWPAVRTVEPPVCAAHAPLAARWCPRLRHGGYAALLVRQAPLAAVEGTLYRPTGEGQVEARQRAVFELDEDAGHQDVDARFLLAEYLVRRLEDVTAVDLRDPELYRDAVPCDAAP
ncbi:hypothetical protein [Streptomyces sp. CC208A]|uniref:hypothetical protein n=1 Tax=Streptomyces sp. CC208A TaxID=3044573 RepID=UPI0024A8B939|nr:hypothetical protein [Streptomyces sp. CC208A]